MADFWANGASSCSCAARQYGMAAPISSTQSTSMRTGIPAQKSNRGPAELDLLERVRYSLFGTLLYTLLYTKDGGVQSFRDERYFHGSPFQVIYSTACAASASRVTVFRQSVEDKMMVVKMLSVPPPVAHNNSGRARWASILKELCTIFIPRLRGSDYITQAAKVIFPPTLNSASTAIFVAMESAECNLREYQAYYAGLGLDLSLGEKMVLCQDVALGIKLLHAIGIAHGDVKRDNVLIFQRGGQYRAKIADFGLSYFKGVDNSGFEYNVHGCSSPYDAPEICRILHNEDVDQWDDKPPQDWTIDDMKRTDLYSLGLLIWEAFQNGRPVFQFLFEQNRTSEADCKSFEEWRREKCGSRILSFKMDDEEFCRQVADSFLRIYEESSDPGWESAMLAITGLCASNPEDRVLSNALDNLRTEPNKSSGDSSHLNNSYNHTFSNTPIVNQQQPSSFAPTLPRLTYRNIMDFLLSHGRLLEILHWYQREAYIMALIEAADCILQLESVQDFELCRLLLLVVHSFLASNQGNERIQGGAAAATRYVVKAAELELRNAAPCIFYASNLVYNLAKATNFVLPPLTVGLYKDFLHQTISSSTQLNLFGVIALTQRVDFGLFEDYLTALRQYQTDRAEWYRAQVAANPFATWHRTRERGDAPGALPGGTTNLMNTVASFSNDIVRRYLQDGDSAGVNLRQPITGATPLHWACFVGNLEGVELLLDAGADPGIPNMAGAYPIHFLCFYRGCDLEDLLSVTRRLVVVASGCSVIDTAITVPPKEMQQAMQYVLSTPLSNAVNERNEVVAETLLLLGANPSEGFVHPVLIAARTHQSQALAMLLDAHSSLGLARPSLASVIGICNSMDFQGRVFQNGIRADTAYLDTMGVILQKYDEQSVAEYRVESGGSLVYFLASRGGLDFNPGLYGQGLQSIWAENLNIPFKAFEGSSGTIWLTPLQNAIALNNMTAFEFLLAAGASPHTRGKGFGGVFDSLETCEISTVIVCGHASRLNDERSCQFARIILSLLERKDLQTIDNRALFFAIRYGKVKLARLLATLHKSDDFPQFAGEPCFDIDWVDSSASSLSLLAYGVSRNSELTEIVHEMLSWDPLPSPTFVAADRSVHVFEIAAASGIFVDLEDLPWGQCVQNRTSYSSVCRGLFKAYDNPMDSNAQDDRCLSMAARTINVEFFESLFDSMEELETTRVFQRLNAVEIPDGSNHLGLLDIVLDEDRTRKWAKHNLMRDSGAQSAWERDQLDIRRRKLAALLRAHGSVEQRWAGIQRRHLTETLQNLMDQRSNSIGQDTSLEIFRQDGWDEFKRILTGADTRKVSVVLTMAMEALYDHLFKFTNALEQLDVDSILSLQQEGLQLQEIVTFEESLQRPLQILAESWAIHTCPRTGPAGLADTTPITRTSLDKLARLHLEVIQRGTHLAQSLENDDDMVSFVETFQGLIDQSIYELLQPDPTKEGYITVAILAVARDYIMTVWHPELGQAMWGSLFATSRKPLDKSFSGLLRLFTTLANAIPVEEACEDLTAAAAEQGMELGLVDMLFAFTDPSQLHAIKRGELQGPRSARAFRDAFRSLMEAEPGPDDDKFLRHIQDKIRLDLFLYKFYTLPIPLPGDYQVKYQSAAADFLDELCHQYDELRQLRTRTTWDDHQLANLRLRIAQRRYWAKSIGQAVRSRASAALMDLFQENMAGKQESLPSLKPLPEWTYRDGEDLSETQEVVRKLLEHCPRSWRELVFYSLGWDRSVALRNRTANFFESVMEVCQVEGGGR